MKIRGTLFLKIKFTYRYGDNDDVSGLAAFLEQKFLEEQFMRIYDTSFSRTLSKCTFRMS